MCAMPPEVMGIEPPACHWKFTGLPDAYFNFAAEFECNPAYKVTTMPALGLNANFKEFYNYNQTKSTGAQESNKKPWESFKNYVEYMNTQSPDTTCYKVLYITRHGLGYHNVYETQVGRDAWNTHWSHVDGDGDIVWADSELNEEGKKQVSDLGNFWSDLVSDEKVPLPGAIYTSPLARTLQTTDAVFREIFNRNGVPFHPILNEMLRERITGHTCDRRSTRSWIAANFPDYVIPSGFTERDELWCGDHWETEEEHVLRKQDALEYIFNNDNNRFIALTTHSYAISAILTVFGMKTFRVREGSSLAILVKAERVAPNKSERPVEKTVCQI